MPAQPIKTKVNLIFPPPNKIVIDSGNFFCYSGVKINTR